MADVPATWAAAQGYKKAAIVGVNQGGTLENTDAFASTFIKQGGAIVQELHPSEGTQDYGPIIAQINQTADVLMTFLPGTDGIRFFQQYADYAGQKKPQLIDGYGGNTSGQALTQLQDKAVGVVGEDVYSLAIDSPENQALVKAWNAKYANRQLSDDGAKGYSAAEVLVAAIKNVNGNLTDKQKFLQALYDTNVQTPRGPIKLDQDHDVIANAYVWQVEKSGQGYSQKLLKTYDSLSRGWDRTADELAKFPYGKLKDKWVGMTKPQLEALTAGGSAS
jgi:branched-chain amino acid transport system substrate-binding protein